MIIEKLGEPARSDLTVAHVIAPGVVGGAESVVRALAIGRHKCVGRTVVAALTQEPGRHPYVEALRKEGVPTVEIDTGRRRYLSEARALAEALREHGVALVHTHVYHADFVGYWAARSLGLPVVATCHGQTQVDWKNDLYQWMDLRLLRRFDAVVCVSQRRRERLLRSGCPPRLLHVIPNGHVGGKVLDPAEARFRLGVPPEGLIVGWVGRLSPEKGPDLFVRAFAKIGVAGTLAVMIGEGPEWERTITLARELRVEDRVRLLGQRADVAQLFTALDCLVISSRNEGLPMVLWEAVAAGTPVVAFSVGGIPEVLTADSAWLVEPTDTSALGAAIAEAVTCRRETRERVKRARLIMEEHYGGALWASNMGAQNRRPLYNREPQARRRSTRSLSNRRYRTTVSFSKSFPPGFSKPVFHDAKRRLCRQRFTRHLTGHSIPEGRERRQLVDTKPVRRKRGPRPLKPEGRGPVGARQVGSPGGRRLRHVPVGGAFHNPLIGAGRGRSHKRGQWRPVAPQREGQE